VSHLVLAMVCVCVLPPGSVLLRIGLGSTAPGSEDWTADLRRLDELIPYELRVSRRLHFDVN